MRQIAVVLFVLGVSSAVYANAIQHGTFTVRNSGGSWDAYGSYVGGSWLSLGGKEVFTKIDRCIEEAHTVKDSCLGRPSLKRYSNGVGFTFTKRNEWDQYVSADPDDIPSCSIEVSVTYCYERKTCSPWYYDYNYTTERCELERCTGSNQYGMQPNCKTYTCSSNKDGRTDGTYPNCRRPPRDP